MIGQVLVSKRSDVICGAVLCNTAFQIGTADRWAERIAAIEQGGLASIAEMVVNNWFGPNYAAKDDRMSLHQAMIGRTTDVGYTAACAATRDADLSEYARSIAVPVLCIGGIHDKFVPPSADETLAQTIPQGDVRILDD